MIAIDATGVNAPAFIATPAELAGLAPGSPAVLVGDEAHHAARVRRLRPGSAIAVVDGRGRRVTGVVEAASRDEISYRVTDVVDEPEPAPRLVVVQALAKGDRGEQAVALLTEVGVDAIVPWAARNCIATWEGERAERGRQRWRATARESAKQARRARIPEIAAVGGLDDIVAAVSAADLAVLLDEGLGGVEPLLDPPATGEVVIVVGPEGGVSPQEREALVGAGAVSVRLGPTVMRTSTAGTVGAAVLLAHSRRWQAGSRP